MAVFGATNAGFTPPPVGATGGSAVGAAGGRCKLTGPGPTGIAARHQSPASLPSTPENLFGAAPGQPGVDEKPASSMLSVQQFYDLKGFEEPEIPNLEGLKPEQREEAMCQYQEAKELSTQYKAIKEGLESSESQLLSNQIKDIMDDLQQFIRKLN